MRLQILFATLAVVGLFATRPGAAAANTAPVDVTSTDLAAPAPCSGTFVTHKLPFANGTRLRDIETYISNGSGVAANDLDADGDLDLVFARIDGDSAILWNEGDLYFSEETLDDQFARGVAIVDVDGDGALDIVFTHRGLESLSFWRNAGPGGRGGAFVRQPLPGVDHYAYAQAWGDLNGDGRLDLVTGSYAAELKQHGVDDPAQDARAGLVLHLRQGERFVPQPLDPAAETLSVGLVDLDDDGTLEIWAANDFGMFDQVWQHEGEEWLLTQPFRQTSHSTMSVEWGDIANSGHPSLFSTDMHPYERTPQSLAAWMPVMEMMEMPHDPGDPQVMANVLQVRNPRGLWRNVADRYGVKATGWSWAAKFGDLDSDGSLDLYVVNGMIAADMFEHLDNHELVEENQAFRNRGNGLFDPAPEWGLGSTASGRGMVMADLDGDGDLDIVVNNLRGFAELHENRLCGGDGLLVDLRWPEAPNGQAVGARLRLHTAAGLLSRDVRASGGYLSGDPFRAHFGFPAGAALGPLEIVWPDGAVSTVDDVAAQTHLVVTRR